MLERHAFSLGSKSNMESFQIFRPDHGSLDYLKPMHRESFQQSLQYVPTSKSKEVSYRVKAHMYSVFSCAAVPLMTSSLARS